MAHLASCSDKSKSNVTFLGTFCTMLSTHPQLTLPLPEFHTERMKRLSQCGDDAELRMCLVVKVKPDAEYIEQYCTGTCNERPSEARQTRHGQTGDGKSEQEHFRNH